MSAMTQVEMRVARHVPIAMRDGVVLRADVWLPEGRDKLPTLLQRTPYDKSLSFGAQHIVGLEPARAVENGFAVVIQDTRGRYSSDGLFAPFVSESADGDDTVRWIREQPFSDGTVHMYGASYVGATQMLAASVCPGGLTAIAPQFTGSEYYDSWTYTGGALQLAFILLWTMESLGAPEIERLLNGTRTRAMEVLQRMRRDPGAAFAQLPILNDDLRALAPYAAAWFEHPSRDDFWTRIDPSVAYSKMGIAALHIAGLHDIFLEGSLRNFVGMRTHAPTTWARRSQYLVLGPWSHGNPSDWQGDTWYGYSAATTELDFTSMHTEFFKSAREGRPAELPRVRLFTTGRNTWRDERQWPLSRAREKRLYLASSGAANSDAGDGHLSFNKPHHRAPSDSYVSDPTDPVPTVGGSTFLPGLLLGRNSGPKHQQLVEARRDVLVYTSDALTKDLEVTGHVTLELFAATSATDCDWTGKVTDVDESGRSWSIADGILRSRYRAGFEVPRPLEPGKPERYTISVGTVSHVFRAGHRIRLQVASSNFPRFDRNPQRFVPVQTATAGDMEHARQTVFHDADHPSALLLPFLE